MEKLVKNKSAVIILMLALLVPVSLNYSRDVHAVEFNQNRIMEDAYFEDHGSMSLSEIQDFLENLNDTILDEYRTENIGGEKKLASEIIYDVSQEFKINPEFFLALVEKEQGLLTDLNPSIKALDWATGFGDYGDKRRMGFGKQIYFAGKVMAHGGDYDKYSDYYDWFKVGKVSGTLDGYKVNPENNITRKCYLYNPLRGDKNARFGANWLLWHLIAERYAEQFAAYTGDDVEKEEKKDEKHPEKYFYRDGTVVRQVGFDEVYLIDGNKKFEFSGQNALGLRYDSSEIVEIANEELANFEYGGKIGLPNGVVVQRKKGGAVYLVNEGNLKGVSSSKVLEELGFSNKDIIKIDDAEANFHKISSESFEEEINVRPNDVLVRTEGQNLIYLYKDKKLYPIMDKKIKNVNFEYHPVVEISEKEADGYKIVKPLIMRDGTLLTPTEGKDKGVVYIIANGNLCAFSSKEKFDEAGYSLENVVKVPLKVFEMHTIGERI